MPKTRFTAILSTFILCMGIWVLITWSFSVQELAAGALVSLAAALFVSGFFKHEDGYRFYGLFDILKLVVLYTVTFVVELVKANIDMAKRVYGGCKVNPGIVRVPTDMTSDQGLALVANSITLTPGTYTLFQEGDHFVVHCLKREYGEGMEESSFIKYLRLLDGGEEK